MAHTLKSYPFVAQMHAPVIPPLTNGMDANRHSVIIAGGGPVGLSLALGLANYGVRSVVLEADESVCQGSRAICVSRRSLEIVGRLGALDAFLAKGLPWAGGRTYFRNAEVLHFKMPHDDMQKLPPMINIEQFYIEQFLLDEAKRRSDLIEIRWQSRVTAVEQAAAGIAVDVATPDSGYRLTGDWLVACDGGRSTVRECLDLPLEGTSYEGRYVIADIELETDLPTERLAWFDPPSNPGSSILMHKQPDNIWRIDYQLSKNEDAEEAIKPENVIPRIRSHLKMIGQDRNWSVLWIAIYKAHALSLKSYRHGRVLFAGDAAHLVPIFGVRGLNSGFDDADNLAWKLGLTVRGAASDDLLDTYSSERVFAAHENLKFGTKSTEFMAPPTFAFQLMRNAVLTLAVDHPELRSLINPRQTSAIAYAQSPLNGVSNHGFNGGPEPGSVLPECPLTIYRRGQAVDGFLTDLIGPRFTALCFRKQSGLPNEFAQLEADMSRLQIPFKAIPFTQASPREGDLCGQDESGRLFHLFGVTEEACYLIRPDGHVHSRWTTLSAPAVRAAMIAALEHQPALSS